MPKVSPEIRWRREVLERYQGFQLSGEFKLLRQKGLKALGRRNLLDSEEWWQESRHQGSMASSVYEEFRLECKNVGDQFGLYAGVVEMACLLKGYSPETSPFVVERNYWSAP